jgi:hypothetical protein
MLFGQPDRLGFEIRGVYPPFSVFILIFSLLLLYFPLIFLSIGWGNIQFKNHSSRSGCGYRRAFSPQLRTVKEALIYSTGNKSVLLSCIANEADYYQP